MQAIGYCRADPTSASPSDELASQRRVIAFEVARRGWKLLDVFEDVSAGRDLLGREGLQRALAALESGVAYFLVMADMTRLGTRLEDIAWLLYAGKRRDWQLLSVAERLTTDDPAAGPLLSVFDTFVPVVAYVTFDCENPDALADFWAAATRWRKESSPKPGHYAVVSDLSGQRPALWFNKVPEPKVVKNRVHICLNVRTLKEEIERLVRLGATKSEEHSSSSGKNWVVMHDPEGNEFCLVPASRT